MQLFQVSKSFQDDQIYAFFIQGCNLFTKGVPRFGKRNLAERLNAYSQWADSAGNHRIEALGRLACQAGTLPVDVSELVQTSVLRTSETNLRQRCLFL